MVNSKQVINGVILFMDNHMIPKAEGNYKIILRTARAGMMIAPEKFWDIIKNNALISMLGVIDENEHVDIDLLANILSEGIGSEEFNLSFKFLGDEYKIYLSKDDIHTLKNYIERS